MKLFNMIALGLAATAGAAYAQQEPAQTQVRAYVQFERSRPTVLSLKKANGKDKFVYTVQDQEMQGNADKCKLFFIQTPADLASAIRTLKERDFASARKQLAAVKGKYAAWQGLPGDPSTKAALLELECAVRQLDLEGLKGLVSSFPHADWLEGEDKLQFAAARVLAGVSDDPAAAVGAREKAEGLLKNETIVSAINSRAYGWLKYAIGRSYAAEIPAAELSGTISEANVQKANLAIDNLCQAAMSSHGADMELPVDAMRRAQAILWAMPGVKDYANRIGKMDRRRWSDAPANFRDAVSLAYLIKNVYDSDNGKKDAALDKAASYFFNAKSAQD